MKELIMVGIHEETYDQTKSIPASIIKIYENDSTDCFNEKLIASIEQIYARKNKKLNMKKLSIDDFKGSKGIQEDHYNIDSLRDFVEMIIDDGYRMIRITKHNENELADNLFKHVMQYGIRNADKAMSF